MTSKGLTKVRCKGCGVKFCGFWGNAFALHLTCSRECAEAYTDGLVSVGEHEVIAGTLHMVNTGQTGRRKWQVHGVVLGGEDVIVDTMSHKAKAERRLKELTA